MANISSLPLEIMEKVINEIPQTHLGTLSNLSLTCKSLYYCVLPHLYRSFHISLEGYKAAGGYVRILESLSASKNPCKPSNYIMGIVLDGYWISPDEVDADDYRTTHMLSVEDAEFEDISGPFDKALVKFIKGLPNLEDFKWMIVHVIPQEILKAISILPHFKSFIAYCDPHIVSTAEIEREFVVGLDPTYLASSSLETLHMLEISDLQQVIQFGDVIRSPGTWGKLRDIKITLSTWYSCKQVDIEPHDHDILSVIFRPHPASQCTKLKLTHLALSDLQCHSRGARALCSCVDPSTLEDLYFYFIHDASKIFNTWTPSLLQSQSNEMKMPNLKRLYIREEREFPYLETFLSQFIEPKHKGGKGLEWLELHSWHLDVPFAGGILWGGFHSNPGVDIPFSLLCALAGERKTIGDTQVVDEKNSWGLTKMYLDLRRNGPFGGPKIVDSIQDFLSPFWRLEILAIPISYEEDMWSDFVQTASALPELRILYLLNFRNEKEAAGGLYRMPRPRAPARQPPQRKPRHWGVAAKDALEIAKGNRLYTHNASEFPEGKSSNYSLDRTWRGKLEYIGIRNIKPDADRETLVWKITLKRAKLRNGKSKHEMNEFGESVELVKLDPKDVVSTSIFWDK